jgi:hypothetical protein
MREKAKLHWAEFPRHALRRGAACEAGGARIMLLTGDAPDAEPLQRTADTAAKPDREREAGEPR